MMFLPRSLSTTTDAQNALDRLTPLFLADTNAGQTFDVDEEQRPALIVKDATFEWESSAPEEKGKASNREKGDKGGKVQEGNAEKKPIDMPPFQMKDVSMVVQRGQLVAITGVVGSGKVILPSSRLAFSIEAALYSPAFYRVSLVRCVAFVVASLLGVMLHTVRKRHGCRMLPSETTSSLANRTTKNGTGVRFQMHVYFQTC